MSAIVRSSINYDFIIYCNAKREMWRLILSVPMTLNDVIVHTRQFVIALVSVDGCSAFPDPDGFLDVPDSSVGFLVNNFHPRSQSMVWLSVTRLRKQF